MEGAFATRTTMSSDFADPPRAEHVRLADASILHVVAPAPAGGLESVVALLAGGHARRGAQVTIASVLEPDGVQPSAFAAARASGVRLETFRVAPRAYLRERSLVARLCRTIRPDVVHTHGFRPDVVDASVARELGIPTVSTVHGWTNSGLRGRIYENLQRAALRRFDAVVPVSRPIHDDLVASGVRRERLHTMRNAFAPAGPPLGRAEARGALGVRERGFRIGWVGRVSHEKGLDVLVKAIGELVEERVDVSVVGTGVALADAQALSARLGVADSFTWHGLLADAGCRMSAFDALVLSSRMEGTPMVLLEAMAAGTPIIATAVGGVPDVVGEDAALLVPPDDPRALAAAIRRLRAEPDDARDRARLAARRVFTHFAVEPWLDGHAALYGRLVSRRVARPRVA